MNSNAFIGLECVHFMKVALLQPGSLSDLSTNKPRIGLGQLLESTVATSQGVDRSSWAKVCEEMLPKAGGGAIYGQNN